MVRVNLGQALDLRCGWRGKNHEHTVRIPNISSMTPLVLKLATMRPEVYHEFPVENMPDTSQAGVITNDSGYESYGSASHATDTSFELITINVDEVDGAGEDNGDPNNNDISEIMSTYSVGMPDPQFGGVYIEEFSRCLVEDIRLQLDSESALGPNLTAHLPNLLQRFGRRIHTEAENRTQREAAVFLRRHRG